MDKDINVNYKKLEQMILKLLDTVEDQKKALEKLYKFNYEHNRTCHTAESKTGSKPETETGTEAGGTAK